MSDPIETRLKNAVLVTNNSKQKFDDVKQNIPLYVYTVKVHITNFQQDKGHPDNRGFSCQAKNGEKRKTSEEIVSKSC